MMHLLSAGPGDRARRRISGKEDIIRHVKESEALARDSHLIEICLAKSTKVFERLLVDANAPLLTVVPVVLSAFVVVDDDLQVSRLRCS